MEKREIRILSHEEFAREPPRTVTRAGNIPCFVEDIGFFWQDNQKGMYFLYNRGHVCGQDKDLGRLIDNANRYSDKTKISIFFLPEDFNSFCPRNLYPLVA